MKLYRSADGRWHVPGQQPKNTVRLEVPTDSIGLCDFLNRPAARFAGPQAEPDPLGDGSDYGVTTISEPAKPCPVRASIALDEEFEALPLARQLHLAALALENARNKL